MPGDSDWINVVGWVYAACTLAENSKFLVQPVGENLLQGIRKAIADVSAAVKSMEKYIWSDVESAMARQLHTAIRELLCDYQTKNTKLLEDAVKQTEEDLRSALELVLPLAYGSNKAGVAWSKTLKAKATSQDVVTLAKDKHLMEIDCAKLEKDMAVMTNAKDKWQHALGMAGRTVDEELPQRADTIACRALQTCVEQELVKLMDAKKSADKDAMRTPVQAAIRRLRGPGYKEKELLPTALYKWSYAQLTAR